MKDIKIELNTSNASGEAHWCKRCDTVEAEIARLRAVNVELVEALEKIARGVNCPEGIIKRPDFYASQDYFEHIARAALSRAEQAKPETCRWTELGNGIFVGCGHNYFSSDFRYCLQNPAKEAFCPVCGKRVEVKK